jgi:hypothetical protein
MLTNRHIPLALSLVGCYGFCTVDVPSLMLRRFRLILTGMHPVPTYRGKCKYKLGKWIESKNQWEWYYHKSTERLYQRNSIGWSEWHYIPGRSSRQAMKKFANPEMATEVPTDLIRASISDRGEIRYLQSVDEEATSPALFIFFTRREEYNQGFGNLSSAAINLGKPSEEQLMKKGLNCRQQWLRSITAHREFQESQRSKNQAPREILDGQGYVWWIRHGKPTLEEYREMGFGNEAEEE